MNEITPEAAPDGKTLQPLEGEAGVPDVHTRSSTAWSGKGLAAVGALVVGLLVGAGLLIQHYTGGAGEDEDKPPALGTQPTAVTATPRRLEVPLNPVAVASTAEVNNGFTGPSGPRVPALQGTEIQAEPIGVRRTGSGTPNSGGPTVPPPEDAPVMLVTSKPGGRVLSAGAGMSAMAPMAQRAALPAPAPVMEEAPLDPNDPMAASHRNLQAYQQQLQGLLDSLTQASTAAVGSGRPDGGMGAPLGGPASGGPLPGIGGIGSMLPGATPSGGALFGGQLAASNTPRVAASHLGNRSLILPKGTAFTCALKTKLISAASGLVGCQVQRNVYSDDGRVLLVERGSHLDGEYRIGAVRPGTVRIPVLWTRIRTPQGVVVDIDSPGTGKLGESGIDGYVDNRWGERLGAAMLLSLIDDTVKLVIQNQTESGAETIVLPSTTSSTSKLAEKVLDSTINIPPLIYQNQGGIVGIYVARDVDFSGVYELQPTALDRAAQTPGAVR